MKSMIDQIKRRIAVWCFRYLFLKPARKYVNKVISDKDEDLKGYLYDLLRNDETRMVMSKEGLHGYFDLDIEMNRTLQSELIQYVDENN